MARAKVNQDINLDEYQDIWVIGEQREGKLHPVTLELIGEGRKLADEAGKKLYVAVPGYDIDEEIAKLLHYHVDGIFYLKHPLFPMLLNRCCFLLPALTNRMKNSLPAKP